MKNMGSKKKQREGGCLSLTAGELRLQYGRTVFDWWRVVPV